MTEFPIKFFCIVSSYGQPLLTLKIDSSINENLLSGLLSAVYAMGKESLTTNISKISIESGKDRVESFIKVNKDGKIQYIAFALVENDFSEKEFRMLAEKVLNDFHDKYSDTLISWNGDICEFEGFSEYINGIIHEQYSEKHLKFENQLDDLFDKISCGDLSGLDDL